MNNIGTFVPPQNVAAQNAIQICRITGVVVYRSADLVAAKTTLPLTAATRQHLEPGDTSQTVATVGNQRLLISTTLLQSHNAPSAILQVAQSLSDLDQTLATLRQILLVGGGVATLVAFGVGWWLAGTALRPIKRMTQTAQEIGDTQDFSRRVAYTGPTDEVGRLAATFNTMLSRLQSAYHTQRRFVADASHELRTPLTSIRGLRPGIGKRTTEPPGQRSAATGTKRYPTRLATASAAAESIDRRYRA
jgi:signal transduction histidine kinase